MSSSISIVIRSYGQERLPEILAAIRVLTTFLEAGGLRHEIIPLPFKRKVGATLHLVFIDGSVLELVGSRPFIELSGSPFYLEEIS